MSAPHLSESTSARGSGAAPAYATAPRRSGLLVALACVVALAAAGALAMFLFGATAPTSAVPKPPSDEAREAMAAAKAALDEASKSVLQPQGASAPAQDATAAAPAPEPPRPEPVTPAVPAPAAEPPRTAAAAPADGARPAPKPEAAKSSAPRSAPAPKAAPATPEPAVVAAAPVPAPEPAPAATADRWAQMKAEIAKCWGGSVLGLQCERRVRVRYCEGYWGSVPECSTGRTDHGN